MRRSHMSTRIALTCHRSTKEVWSALCRYGIVHSGLAAPAGLEPSGVPAGPLQLRGLTVEVPDFYGIAAS